MCRSTRHHEAGPAPGPDLHRYCIIGIPPGRTLRSIPFSTAVRWGRPMTREKGAAMATAHGASLDIPTPDGVADAYLAHPDDGNPHPGVLLYPDAFGPRATVEEAAKRL